MILCDTHFHLPEPELIPSVLADAAAKGVTRMLACADSIESAEQCRGWAEKDPHVFFAAGIHPQNVSGYSAEKLAELTASERCRAVGEIGLDYYYSPETAREQRILFEKMLEHALKVNLPASIHCRDAEGFLKAYDDAYALLSAFAADGGKFVLHCYSGTPEDSDRFAAIGAYFGVGGMVTFKRAENIRELLRHYPADRILLETDSPYLAPVPLRGTVNVPGNIPLIAEAAAAVRNLDAAEFAGQTTANACRLFFRE